MSNNRVDSSASNGLWQDYDNRVMACQEYWTANTDVYIVMRKFMEEKVSEDPLVWWKRNGTVFPLLNKVATNILELLQRQFQQRNCFPRQEKLLVSGEVALY